MAERKDHLFDSPEEAVVAALRALLPRVDHPDAQGVHVGVRKLNDPKKARQVIVRGDGGYTVEGYTMLLDIAFGVNVWAPTYYEARNLAKIVAALLRRLPQGAENIKHAEVDRTPLEITEEDEQEHQWYLTGTAVIQGTTTNLLNPTP